MNKLTMKRIYELFGENSDISSKWKGDNFFQGLQIIAKYIDPMKEDLIVAAEHDMIYSVEGQQLLDAGITDDDLVALAGLNWSFDEEIEQFCCNV